MTKTSHDENTATIANTVPANASADTATSAADPETSTATSTATTTESSAAAAVAAAIAGSGPVAVVTGASRGLGRELARALAGAGWRLVLTARSSADLLEVAEELAPRTTVVALAGTVVDDEHRAELAHAAALLGGADLLVNNASTLAGYDLAGEPMPSLARFPLPGLLETFEVNVLGPIALTQLLLPQLRRVGGAVVNLSSDAAVEPYAGWGGYGASKAAFDHASVILALEEPDVRVWAVDPGDMLTVMHQDAFPGEDISDRPLPATVVPAFLHLLADKPESGRYRAADLLAAAAGPARADVRADTDTDTDADSDTDARADTQAATHADTRADTHTEPVKEAA